MKKFLTILITLTLCVNQNILGNPKNTALQILREVLSEEEILDIYNNLETRAISIYDPEIEAKISSQTPEVIIEFAKLWSEFFEALALGKCKKISSLIGKAFWNALVSHAKKFKNIKEILEDELKAQNFRYQKIQLECTQNALYSRLLDCEKLFIQKRVNLLERCIELSGTSNLKLLKNPLNQKIIKKVVLQIKQSRTPKELLSSRIKEKFLGELTDETMRKTIQHLKQKTKLLKELHTKITFDFQEINVYLQEMNVYLVIAEFNCTILFHSPTEIIYSILHRPISEEKAFSFLLFRIFWGN